MEAWVQIFDLSKPLVFLPDFFFKSDESHMKKYVYFLSYI